MGPESVGPGEQTVVLLKSMQGVGVGPVAGGDVAHTVALVKSMQLPGVEVGVTDGVEPEVAVAVGVGEGVGVGVGVGVMHAGSVLGVELGQLNGLQTEFGLKSIQLAGPVGVGDGSGVPQWA